MAIDENISNETTSENGYMEISVEVNGTTKPNKNIWKGVKNTNIKNTNNDKKFESNIKFKLKSESLDSNVNLNTNNNTTQDSEITSKFNSESSEIEESEICFDDSN